MLRERLAQVGNQVVDLFNPDGEPGDGAIYARSFYVDYHFHRKWTVY